MRGLAKERTRNIDARRRRMQTQGQGGCPKYEEGIEMQLLIIGYLLVINLQTDQVVREET